MKILNTNLIAIFVALMLSISPASFADEKTDPNFSGCVCRIDEANGTIDIIPWISKKYDYGTHQTFDFSSHTEFILKEGSKLKLKQAGQEYPVPYDDKELTARSELVGHHVEVIYNEKEGKRLATLIRLKYHTIIHPPYITIGGNPTEGWKVITKCSCTSEK